MTLYVHKKIPENIMPTINKKKLHTFESNGQNSFEYSL